MLIKLISFEEFKKISPDSKAWYFDNLFKDTRKKLLWGTPNIYNVKKHNGNNENHYAVNYNSSTGTVYLIEEQHCIIIDIKFNNRVLKKFEKRLSECKSIKFSVSPSSLDENTIYFAEQRLENVREKFLVEGINFADRNDLNNYYNELGKIIKKYGKK